MTDDRHASVVAHGLEAVVPRPSVVTIGNFDGVHRGHQALLRRTVVAASEQGIRSVAVTFDPHPAAVLRPGTEPVPLQSLDDRVASLAATGIDLVLVLPFTRELSALSPEEFVRQVLVERIRARRMIVGTNFRFGHKAVGDVATLVAEGELSGFDVEAVPLLVFDGVAISSSSVRANLDAGDVAWTRRALGRAYSLVGEIVAGEGRGRTIGVPTANLAIMGPVVVPAAGVYAGHADVQRDLYPCVTNVGTRPTFGPGGHQTVEVHLLDTDADLYGQQLRVTFEHRLRGEQRFDGPQALVAQIRDDVARARQLLAAG